MRAGRDLADVREMQEIIADLLLGELVGRTTVEPGELHDGVHIGMHSALGVAAEPEILGRALAEWSHGILSGEWVREDDQTTLRHAAQLPPGKTS
jgi:hypothetical protein